MWRQIIQQNSRSASSQQRLVLLRRLQSTVSTTTQDAVASIIPLGSSPQRSLSSLQHHHHHHEAASSFEMKALTETLHVALVSPHMNQMQQAPQVRRLLPAVTTVAEAHDDHNICEQDGTTGMPEKVEDGIIVCEQDGTTGMPQQVVEGTREAAAPMAARRKAATPMAARAVATSPMATASMENAARPKARNTPAAQQWRKTNEARKQHTKRIQACMNKNMTNDVMLIIREASVTFDSTTLHNVFRYFLTRNPLYSFEILQKHYADEDITLDMYERQCRAVGTLCVAHGSQRRTHLAVEKLCNRILRTQSLENQHHLLPILLECTLASSLTSVRSFSTQIYNHLSQQEDFKFEADCLERLLPFSRYYQNFLPYHVVLQQLSATGVAPQHPEAIAQVLSHMFPFRNDLEATTQAVLAVLEMVLTHDETTFPIDVGTLEAILAAAARAGSFDLGLLTWDLVENLGHEPTEGMYESMVQAFAMSYRQDHRAFACLVEMEEVAGFTPSRALLRSMSRSIRFSVNRIDNAYRMLVSYQHGCKPTQAALNVIMSGTAEIGDVDRTFSVLLDDFPVNRIANPNQDSYSFAMESLARSTVRSDDDDKKKKPVISDEEKRSVLNAAERLLDMMNEEAIPIDGDVLQSYVQALIHCDELELATKTTLDALEAAYEVGDYTIIQLVHEHGGKHGNFAMARDLARRTTEPLSYLWRRIDKWESLAKSKGLEIIDDDAEVETISFLKDDEEEEIADSVEWTEDEESDLEVGVTSHEEEPHVPAA